MLRAESCICGTSSTGTGTLALSACPTPPGGTDLYQAFNAQSLGTATSIPISYTIIEYTANTFLTATKQEKGVGSLTLGANLAASTLARTTVQQTAINMESTSTYDTSAPTPINISTAANVLVFIGASASDLMACSPYFDTTLPSSDALGALPVNMGGSALSSSGSGVTLVSGRDHYIPFEWRVPMLVKHMHLNVGVRNTTGAVLHGRIYAMGANARPTKLLYNFGRFNGAGGSTSAPVGVTGNIVTSATGSGFYLGTGEYFIDLYYSGGFGPQLSTFQQSYSTGRLGYGSGIGVPLVLTATGGTTSAGDPANITGLDMYSALQTFFSLDG